jgi:hypothetical protein
VIPALASIITAYVCFRCVELSFDAYRKYDSVAASGTVILLAICTIAVSLFFWATTMISGAVSLNSLVK